MATKRFMKNVDIIVKQEKLEVKKLVKNGQLLLKQLRKH